MVKSNRGPSFPPKHAPWALIYTLPQSSGYGSVFWIADLAITCLACNLAVNPDARFWRCRPISFHKLALLALIVNLASRVSFTNPLVVMSKLVVDCGNCGPDFNSIRQMVNSNFDASVVQTHGAEDTIELLRERKVDLVTVNRKLDRDYTDGMEVIKQIRAEAEFSDVPIMLVTNYEEHQQTAIQAGCVQGFGKLSIDDDATVTLLEPYLGKAKVQTS